jgi:soluble lytic murein transglycosylase-like protein
MPFNRADRLQSFALLRATAIGSAAVIGAAVLLTARTCRTAVVRRDASPSHKAEVKKVLIEQTLLDAKRLDASARERLAKALLEAEKAHGIDALLILAVIKRESGYDPKARGRRGSVGLMQIRPPTGRAVAEEMGIEWRGADQLKDPIANIRLGATYLAEMKDKFGKWRLALAAYNVGIERLNRMLKSGKRAPLAYAARVLDTYEDLVAQYEDLRNKGVRG